MGVIKDRASPGRGGDGSDRGARKIESASAVAERRDDPGPVLRRREHGRDQECRERLRERGRLKTAT